MNIPLRIPLHASPEQNARLQALQQAFAQACNALSPVVQKTRTWNRVALHHLTYKELRAKFPAIGSQMACNVIYSVSRTCRAVYQHPGSPFNLSKLGDRPLPLLKFTTDSPVYFDRHTLSIKEGQLSLYTLDGRMRFQLNLEPADLQRFRERKLREIVLGRRKDGVYELVFFFSEEDGAAEPPTPASGPDAGRDLPEYVLIEEAA